MDDAELRWLARAARTCRTIVEVGCYQGRSTRALADHCPGTVYAVDPWQGYYPQDDGAPAKWLDCDAAGRAFGANLADHLLTGKVIAIQATFEQAMPELKRRGLCGLADLVFIDGDHRYEEVLGDISRALSFVRPGGTIAGHDYRHKDWPGVKRAVDEAVEGFMLEHSIWWTVAPP
jgi:predicted O-methyltransferase YrrM